MPFMRTRISCTQLVACCLVGICTCLTCEARQTLETLAAEADAYASHISSMGFKTTNVQRIVSKDPSRPEVIADVTTTEVQVLAKGGKAVVSHRTFIGDDTRGELVYATTYALAETFQMRYSPLSNEGVIDEVDEGAAHAVFARERVTSYLFLPTPGFNRPGLGDVLRSEHASIISEKETVYGDEVVVCSVGGVTLWIDAKHGAILRRLEERHDGRLHKLIEVPDLIDSGSMFFPGSVRYVSYNSKVRDELGETLPYLVCDINIEEDSVRINDLEEMEVRFQFPNGVTVRDKRNDITYVTGEAPPSPNFLNDILKRGLRQWLP